jgi:peptidoglycan/xylan/chitin deacetylase (PgdA/CDA1 family)
MTFIAPHFRKTDTKNIIPFFKKDIFFVKTPWWMKRLFPGCTWDVTPKEKTLYLTFDDGPHPTVTPFVLDLLKEYNAKATFFLIGDNVNKYPDIYRRLVAEGHSTGNHTYRHLNGWETKNEEYLEDIIKTDHLIRANLFRPPYGRLKGRQIRMIKEHFPRMKIIMWNILAGDWIQDLRPETCFKKVVGKISDGDIITFHDSAKAFHRLEYILPRLLKNYSEKEYSFRKIEA